MIADPPAHPPAAASVPPATEANAGPRPHPTGDPTDPLLLARGMSSRYLSSRVPTSSATCGTARRTGARAAGTPGSASSMGTGSWPGAGALARSPSRPRPPRSCRAPVLLVTVLSCLQATCQRVYEISIILA